MLFGIMWRGTIGSQPLRAQLRGVVDQVAIRYGGFICTGWLYFSLFHDLFLSVP